MSTSKTLPHTCDRPDQIAACLNCSRPACTGRCALVGSKPRKARGSKLDKKGIGRKLVAMGLTDAQIAQYMGMHIQSVLHWRKTNGISPGCGSGKRRKRNG